MQKSGQQTVCTKLSKALVGDLVTNQTFPFWISPWMQTRNSPPLASGFFWDHAEPAVVLEVWKKNGRWTAAVLGLRGGNHVWVREGSIAIQLVCRPTN